MPLTVPGRKDQSRQPAKPSEIDYMMALGVMHNLGRIPTFDERFRGQDPSSLPIDVGQVGKPIVGRPKETNFIPAEESNGR